MNFQPVIDNLPWILASLGLILWGAARMIEAWAKRNPAIDEWDRRADLLHRVSSQYAEALDWLVVAGAKKYSGAEKLAELNARVKGFETQWEQGNYIEALANLSGFYQDAKAKVEKVAGITLPFPPRPSMLVNTKPPQASAEIGPDDPAVEDTTGK